VAVVPTVDANKRTAWMTVSGISPTTSWNGQLTIHPAGLGLPAGTYHLVNAATGATIQAVPGGNGLTVSLDVTPGFLQIWSLQPGAAPSAAPAAG
jgi:hypothetical protein